MKSSILAGVRIVPIAACTGVFANPTSQKNRDINDVLDSINAIEEDLVAFNTTIASYDGGLNSFTGFAEGLEIQDKASKLVGSVEEAIEVTRETPKFDNEQSQTVAMAMMSLQPKSISMLNMMISKQDVFNERLFGIIPITFLIKDNLERQRELSAELSEVLVSKLTPSFAGLAPTFTKKIDEAFAEAIAVYS